ncbi:MAG TPA: hypothetical protein PKX62_21090 [Spirochaetota bacterium]|jgi:hypothetical protein|nr:hypothetical protein [Spirochaetota bacterium]
MNRYTVRVNADRLKEVIPLPPEFAHREVDVLITLPGKKSFDPRAYRGIFRETKETIDRDIASMRKEWDRHGQ